MMAATAHAPLMLRLQRMTVLSRLQRGGFSVIAAFNRRLSPAAPDARHACAAAAGDQPVGG